MAEGHVWMQSTRDTSICPKCHEFSLQKSNARGAIEQFRKRHSNKRPYRCQKCNWRSWLKEQDLHYPTMKQLALIRNTPITSLDLRPATFDIDDSFYDDAPSPKAERKKNQNNIQSADKKVEPLTRIEKIESQQSLDEAQSRIKVTSGNEDFDIALPPERNFADQFDYSSKRKYKGHIRECPVCGETSLHRSRSRGIMDTLKKKFTNKRVYRCNKCQWRGWLEKG